MIHSSIQSITRKQEFKNVGLAEGNDAAQQTKPSTDGQSVKFERHM